MKILKGEETSWLITKRSPRLDSIKEDKKAVYWTHTASPPTGSKKDTFAKENMLSTQNVFSGEDTK